MARGLDGNTDDPMPGSAPLDALPLWALYFVLLIANILIEEVGFRIGRVRARQAQRESDLTVGAVVAAELALLAFLVAFSFGIVAPRFQLRRQIVLDEANAIGTTYLRAAMLPNGQGQAIRRLLREYTEVRLGATTGTPIEQVLRRSEEIHRELWTETVAAAEHDRSVPVGLFIQSLNEVINLHGAREMAALRNRMPLAVWIVLFAVALLAFFAIGYQSGLTKAVRSPTTLVLALAFSAVTWLVLDLDRPGEGFFRVSQEPMIQVRNMINGRAGQ
jgi:hypothetical protein